MLKITDQYFWNFIWLVFFASLLVMGVIILDTESRLAWEAWQWSDTLLVTLATWRLVYFIASEDLTKFAREQLYSVKKTTRSYTLELPKTGPRRALLEILASPASLSLGVGALVLFVYQLTSYAFYPLAVLALSGVVTLLEVGRNYFNRTGER